MRAKQEKILKIVITAVMVILGLICIYPFIFMLSSSFKPSGDVLSTPLQIIPSNFTMMNFETLFNNEFYDFFQWFGNTVVMTGLTLILKFFIITITAYGFAKRYGDMEVLNAFIARMNGDGFLCCYNHPYWSLQNCTDYQGLQGVFAMEIYNHGCELDGLYGYAPQAYDEMLRAGQKLFCVATDDNHDVYAPGDPRSIPSAGSPCSSWKS